MCQSPNSSVVRRAIELKYANRQRADALRWLCLNGALLALLCYDLSVRFYTHAFEKFFHQLSKKCMKKWFWCETCEGVARSPASWAEAVVAALLAASCARHLTRLRPRPPDHTPAPLSPAQLTLLGLKDSDLDSSFVMAAGVGAQVAGALRARRQVDGEEPGSLCARRSWRGLDSSPSPSRSPPSPHSPPSPAGGGRASPDEFISDTRDLAAYIRQVEGLEAGAGAGGVGAGGVRLLSTPPRPHQLAMLPERGSKEPGGEEEGVGAGGAPLWHRLHVDPRRLTEYKLNLRIWLHVTVVSRVARELEAAGAGVLQAGARIDDTLLAFLRPFADKQYVVDRIKELSVGGCLSAYRWASGGRGWTESRPADADLLMHLFVCYLDLLTSGAFSARHVAPAGAGARSTAADTLALVRARPLPALPPHYVLQLGEETLNVGGGRDNLLHTLLLFLAAAARGGAAGGAGGPPTLCRLHLGPASLNMLWILGQ